MGFSIKKARAYLAMVGDDGGLPTEEPPFEQFEFDFCRKEAENRNAGKDNGKEKTA